MIIRTVALQRSAVSLALSLLLVGCGYDFEPPDDAERIEEAAAVFTTALFDSLSWTSDSVRSEEGNEVYAGKCRRCHGLLGSGGMDYAVERGLDVPSLTEPSWALASMDSLRRVIYIGHEEGMPSWGVSRITPREIDAAAFYLLFDLRPEVLGEGEPPGRP
jgi:mono/diheme cytochrome c family protein